MTVGLSCIIYFGTSTLSIVSADGFLLYRTNAIQAERHCADRFSNGDENEVAIRVENSYPRPVRTIMHYLFRNLNLVNQTLRHLHRRIAFHFRFGSQNQTMLKHIRSHKLKDYPSLDEEVNILERHHFNAALVKLDDITPALTKEELLTLRAFMKNVFVLKIKS